MRSKLGLLSRPSATDGPIATVKDCFLEHLPNVKKNTDVLCLLYKKIL